MLVGFGALGFRTAARCVGLLEQSVRVRQSLFILSLRSKPLAIKDRVHGLRLLTQAARRAIRARCQISVCLHSSNTVSESGWAAPVAFRRAT